MSTVTAVPDARTASVDLTISSAAGLTGIIRADINGTRRVRLREDQLPATGMLTVTDWEPALTGLIQYRLEGQAGDAWTTVGADLPRFHIPSIPQYSQAVETVHQYSSSRETRSIFHEVINRNDSMVAEGRMTPRSGDLAIFFDTYQGARDLEDLLERGKVVHYRQSEHPGMDMYFHATSLRIDPDEDSTWKLAVGYKEVDFPDGYVLSTAGWTFAGLRDSSDSFEAVAQEYGSFVDVAIGEQL